MDRGTDGFHRLVGREPHLDVEQDFFGTELHGEHRCQPDRGGGRSAGDRRDYRSLGFSCYAAPRGFGPGGLPSE